MKRHHQPQLGGIGKGRVIGIEKYALQQHIKML